MFGSLSPTSKFSFMRSSGVSAAGHVAKNNNCKMMLSAVNRLYKLLILF